MHPQAGAGASPLRGLALLVYLVVRRLALPPWRFIPPLPPHENASWQVLLADAYFLLRFIINPDPVGHLEQLLLSSQPAGS